MNVSLSLYSPDHKNSRVDSDPQVKNLEAQIKDWETCPTTDSQTKKQIVGRLVVKVESLKSQLENSQKPAPTPANPSSDSVASGQCRLDVKV